MNKPNLYCLYDKIAKRYTHFMLADTDAMYVRELVAHRVAFPLSFQDCTPICLQRDFDITFFHPEDIPWNAWRTPENEAEILAPLGLTSDEISQIIKNRQKEKTND